MTLLTDTRKKQGQALIEILNMVQGSTESSVDETTVDEIVLQLHAFLIENDFNTLPYAAISQFVFTNENPDFSYFIEMLEAKFSLLLEEKDETYYKCLKLLEHLELAQQQKDSLFYKQEQEIEELRNLKESFKTQKKELEKQMTRIRSLQETTDNMPNNFISILGIFAAILMGAFGALQGFTSLFDNSTDLPMGKLLIISSIGASSVVLILFLLLNAIAKLTGKDLSNTKNDGDPLIKRHPTLVVVYGILVFIALVGSALELCNIQVNFSWSGLWWVFPLGWIVYFIVAFKKNDLLFFIKRSRS
ncbi:hypothetical protein [Salinibacillus xinjiangensis]|uniref:Uncharacterized protein n=1 Tax=Salinibacillus xinjiangensis TaxID=1229268 RepID=A0A6G1X714_9BACI|nr:hypothetical protein [Salinibacillus xinjiangensis]MRG86719.1 hypothetical protein [Salinibacillus xinjiangensis]